MLKWINNLFGNKKIDEKTLEELEESLIIADVGIHATDDIIQKFRDEHLDKDINIKKQLASYIANILEHSQGQIKYIDAKPFIIMVSGVNGAGKTTTIGKLAHILKKQGKQVSLVAADTFRAAAVGQLEEWGNKNKINVFIGMPNQDPASLCFDSLKSSQTRGDDILIIDTAGRLENKTNLMDELKKMVSVIKKIDSSAPHCKILCLDGTTGQSAIGQVKTFDQFIGLDGLIINKLDGSSKAGIVVALAQDFKLPIYYVGTGEGLSDIKEFNAKDFAESMLNV